MDLITGHPPGEHETATKRILYLTATDLQEIWLDERSTQSSLWAIPGPSLPLCTGTCAPPACLSPAHGGAHSWSRAGWVLQAIPHDGLQVR